jgi:hypothetical protein
MKKLLMFLQQGWNIQFFTREMTTGTGGKFIDKKRCSIRCVATKGNKVLSTSWASADTNREAMKFVLANVDALINPKNIKVPKVAAKVKKSSKCKK